MLVARVAARGLERALSALACAALLGSLARCGALSPSSIGPKRLRKQLNDTMW